MDMAPPNPKRQKEALRNLDELFKDAKNVSVIHYSCESFYDRPEGRSPRVTSIAVRQLSSGQTVSFSIHRVAERQHLPFVEIAGHYDSLEKQMLDTFFTYAKDHRGIKYLHWNMRDINFGFPAIEHRYGVLGGDPYIIDEDRKFDLSRLLINVYGVSYVGHPRLERLMEINNIKPRDFLVGSDEALAFEKGNYVGLHQSTLRKVDVIANIASRAHDRTLKTNTTWWQMHGGKLRTALVWMAESRTFQLGAGIASILGLALTLYAMK